MQEGIKIFVSYAVEDNNLREKLEKHLVQLIRDYLLTVWHNRVIQPGADWKSEVDTNLNTAQMTLLLVSSDFMASSYCYGVEMTRAMERHEIGKTCVVPILLRPVDYKGAPFEKLPILPSNGIPVTQWESQDEAFTDIAKALRRCIDDIHAKMDITKSYRQIASLSHRLLSIITSLGVSEQRVEVTLLTQLIQKLEHIEIKDISKFNIDEEEEFLKNIILEVKDGLIGNIREDNERIILEVENEYTKYQDRIRALEKLHQDKVSKREKAISDARKEAYSAVSDFYRSLGEKIRALALAYNFQNPIKNRDLIFPPSRKKSVQRIVEEIDEVIRNEISNQCREWQGSTLQPLVTKHIKRGLSQISELVQELDRKIKEFGNIHIDLKDTLYESSKIPGSSSYQLDDPKIYADAEAIILVIMAFLADLFLRRGSPAHMIGEHVKEVMGEKYEIALQKEGSNLADQLASTIEQEVGKMLEPALENASQAYQQVLRATHSQFEDTLAARERAQAKLKELDIATDELIEIDRELDNPMTQIRYYHMLFSDGSDASL